MFAWLLVFSLIYSTYKFYKSNFSLTSSVLKFFKLYNYLNNNFMKPVKKRFLENYNKIKINKIFKNGKSISLREYRKKNFNEDDIVELQWNYCEHNYRTIFKGDRIDENIIEKLDFSKSQKMNIIMANLHKFNKETGKYEIIDITKQLNEYSGIDGDFFKSMDIINNSRNFVLNSRNSWMLENQDDYIEYMDSMGDMITMKTERQYKDI